MDPAGEVALYALGDLNEDRMKAAGFVDEIGDFDSPLLAGYTGLYGKTETNRLPGAARTWRFTPRNHSATTAKTSPPRCNPHMRVYSSMRPFRAAATAAP
jgi:hypothetical protein